MNPQEARAVVADVFRRIAPGTDLDAVDASADIREELDIDSMDFLNAVIALEERTGVSIPEADYGTIDTLDALVAYLVAHSA